MFKRTPQVFELQLLKRVLHEVKDSVMCVQFYFQGEPLLADTLPEMVRLAKSYGMYCIVSTNAQLLDEAFAARLQKAGLDKIIVSMDGLTQESYEQYRVGGKLERVLKGIKNIKEARQRAGRCRPQIELQWLVLRANEHEMSDIRRLYRQIGADKLVFKDAQFYDYESGNDLMPQNQRYCRYKQAKDGKWELKGKQHNRCFRLWSGAVVDVEGNVRPCCFDKGGEFILGNLYHDSFMRVWFGNKAVRFRKKIIQNRLSVNICRNCTSP